MKRVMIAAGEASGDMHGANLIREMKLLSPEIEIVGVGGRRMEKAGLRPIYAGGDMAVVGIFEVLRKLRSLRQYFRRLCMALEREKIDALILIDYPGMNIRLGRKAKQAGIPVIYYISPQVWAWGAGRLDKISSIVDKMLVIFPFEEGIYREKGVDVEFVGHPLLDTLHDSTMQNYPEKPLVGLLPGSRRQEISLLLPILLKAARLMTDEVPELQFVLPCAESVSRDRIEEMVVDSGLPIEVRQEGAQDCLAACRLAIIASGTATLEAACLGTPMIIVYKVLLPTYLLAKYLLKVRHIGLVNLVAGREIVPEFLQFNARPGQIAREALRLFQDGRERERMEKDLSEVREKLGHPGASRRAAESVLKLVDEKIRGKH